MLVSFFFVFFFFSSRRRHTRWTGDWSSDVCSSDLVYFTAGDVEVGPGKCVFAARSHPIADHRSEERRVGKSVDLGGRRIIKKKKKKKQNTAERKIKRNYIRKHTKCIDTCDDQSYII